MDDARLQYGIFQTPGGVLDMSRFEYTLPMHRDYSVLEKGFSERQMNIIKAFEASESKTKFNKACKKIFKEFRDNPPRDVIPFELTSQHEAGVSK